MEHTQTEIEAIRSQIEALRSERDALTGEEILPGNDSPEAITEAYRHQAREAAKVSTEVEGIDNAIAALEAQLRQKQGELELSPRQQERLNREQEVEQATQRAYDHANRINELAAELAEELKALKAIAHDLSPVYWQLYHKPLITGFRGTSVPYLRSDGNVLMIGKLII